MISLLDFINSVSQTENTQNVSIPISRPPGYGPLFDTSYLVLLLNRCRPYTVLQTAKFLKINFIIIGKLYHKPVDQEVYKVSVEVKDVMVVDR